MRILITFLLGLVAFAASAHAGIDFRISFGETKLDGLIFKHLIFHENGKKIIYEQPAGWNYTGDASRIRLTPPNLSQAQADIEQSPLRAPQNFDEATIKSLQEKTLASVPAGSQKPKLLSEEKNPVLVNGHETYEITVGYQFSGQEFQRSILYLNLPDTQLRFRVTARKDDFEKVHKTFRGSIFSWQWSQEGRPPAAAAKSDQR